MTDMSMPAAMRTIYKMTGRRQRKPPAVIGREVRPSLERAPPRAIPLLLALDGLLFPGVLLGKTGLRAASHKWLVLRLRGEGPRLAGSRNDIRPQMDRLTQKASSHKVAEGELARTHDGSIPAGS